MCRFVSFLLLTLIFTCSGKPARGIDKSPSRSKPVKILAQYYTQEGFYTLPPSAREAKKWLNSLPVKKTTGYGHQFTFVVVHNSAELAALCCGPKAKENDVKLKRVEARLRQVLKQRVDWNKHVLVIAFEAHGSRTASTLKFSTLEAQGKTLTIRFQFIRRANDTFRGFTVALVPRTLGLTQIKIVEEEAKKRPGRPK